jgi:hypothetical protein
MQTGQNTAIALARSNHQLGKELANGYSYHIPQHKSNKGSETRLHRELAIATVSCVVGRGPMTKYILRGVNSDGGEFFYTGKAGDGWVSEDRNEAFDYRTEEVANDKAMTLNQFCPVHGYWFMAVEVDR